MTLGSVFDFGLVSDVKCYPACSASQPSPRAISSVSAGVQLRSVLRAAA
jgi:hypothetical protein